MCLLKLKDKLRFGEARQVAMLPNYGAKLTPSTKIKYYIASFGRVVPDAEPDFNKLYGCNVYIGGKLESDTATHHLTDNRGWIFDFVPTDIGAPIFRMEDNLVRGLVEYSLSGGQLKYHFKDLGFYRKWIEREREEMNQLD